MMSGHLVIRAVAANVQEVTLTPSDCLDAEIICQYCQRILRPRHEVTHYHHHHYGHCHAVHLLSHSLQNQSQKILRFPEK